MRIGKYLKSKFYAVSVICVIISLVIIVTVNKIFTNPATILFYGGPAIFVSQIVTYVLAYRKEAFGDSQGVTYHGNQI